MTTHRARRTAAVLAGAALVITALVTGPVAAAAGAPSSARATWSTDPAQVERTPASTPRLKEIRTGQHAGFDRIVLQLRGDAPGYSVRYVKRLRRDGSGQVVDLRGRRSLEIVLMPADAHNNAGRSTLISPDQLNLSLPELREYELLGDFEAVVTVGVGLRHKKPFRVLTLSNPTRIVVDVAH